ncbi:MAG: hypothetical protein ACLUDU_05850 [Butyricimonas faecihominis]
MGKNRYLNRDYKLRHISVLDQEARTLMVLDVNELMGVRVERYNDHYLRSLALYSGNGYPERPN